MNGIALAKPTSLGESRLGAPERARLRSFDLWWAAFVATLIPVSLIWDFSWESTIGIDRFWSPPHLATHIGVWLCGLLGARLVLVFTRARLRGDSVAGVNIGPGCGPAGAWILLWGAATMQVALLLDNWWQQAYGLGAGIWHPPQLLKTAGFFTLLFGGLALCAGARSVVGVRTRTATALLVWHAGLLLTMCAVVLAVKNYPNWQHTASFYLVSSAIYPAILLVGGGASRMRWGATGVALVYTIVACLVVWLLPLFPARPLTAPIHNATDHMMPPPFPLLLVVPALVLDLLRGEFIPHLLEMQAVKWNKFRAPAAAAFFGIGFVAAFVPTQWLFSKFLLSSSSDNWLFAGAGRHWPFFLKIDEARVMFWGVKQDPFTWRTTFVAVLLAMVSAWIGIRVGTWLSTLRR